MISHLGERFTSVATGIAALMFGLYTPQQRFYVGLMLRVNDTLAFTDAITRTQDTYAMSICLCWVAGLIMATTFKETSYTTARRNVYPIIAAFMLMHIAVTCGVCDLIALVMLFLLGRYVVASVMCLDDCLQATQINTIRVACVTSTVIFALLIAIAIPSTT